MRTLFIILAILIAGSVFAGDGDGKSSSSSPTYYIGCKNYGVNSSYDPSSMMSAMVGAEKSAAAGSLSSKPEER